MLDFENLEKYRENNRIEAKKALGGLPHSISQYILCMGKPGLEGAGHY